MKVLYIAKHGQMQSADDEGAICHALRELGHEVNPIHERKGHEVGRLADQADLMLFHHWDDVESVRSLKGRCVRAFWYFDLVEWPGDPSLTQRNKIRMEWMRRILPHVDVGFCTDGLWVAKDQSGKLVWLPQGADVRIIGAAASGKMKSELLYVGMRNGGLGRSSWVDELVAHYGVRLRWEQRSCYRERLAEAIASSAVVLAPDCPVADRYWSNRVYHSLGFGSFLLHPYSAGLAEHYKDRSEIVFYRSRHGMHEMIQWYLECPGVRQDIAAAGLRRTLAEHTYRHRVAQLIGEIRRRCSPGRA